MFVACFSLALPIPALAAAANPRVYGKTIGDWGQAWWQWALNFPTAINPILAPDGDVDCSAGQSGEVWFLAGNFGGTSIRSCAIPRGKALFFGIINGIYWTGDAPDLAGLRAGVAMGTDAVDAISCSVDGTPCAYFTPIVRVQSAALPLNLPEGSIAVTDFGYAAGVYEESVADGYWVMLDHLKPGDHVIHFTVHNTFGFELDVTFNIEVE
jgi:hypothetical protein